MSSHFHDEVSLKRFILVPTFPLDPLLLMELRSFGNILLKFRSHPSLISLTPSLATSRFLVATGNSPDSVLFNFINSRITFSTCGSSLHAPEAGTAPSPIPESNSNESSEATPVLPPTPGTNFNAVPDAIIHRHHLPRSKANVSPLIHSPERFVWHRDFNKVKEYRLIVDEVGILNCPIRKYDLEGGTQEKRSYPLSALDIVEEGFSRRFSMPRQQASPPGAIHSQMIIPGQTRPFDAHASTASSYRQSVSTKKLFKPRAVRTIESSPRVGRTVEVNPKKGVDLNRALRKLGTNCALNNVRRDLINRRYHERPGMRRKRLKREQWRARFKHGFRALVEKVLAMRKKGW